MRSTKARDAAYPFSRINGKDVNTLIFPNLSAASTAYKMMLEMGLAEAVGPIQMGLTSLYTSSAQTLPCAT